MIKALGKKRVFLLGILLVVNAILGSLIFMYLLPQKQQSERSLRSTNGQVSTVRNDLANLQVDFQELEEQQFAFDRLNSRGFFDLQGRKAAVAALEDLDKRAKIIFSKVSIGAGEIDEKPEALKAGHVILASPISVTIEAMDDVDVFNYIHLLNNVFPGHVSVNEMVIKRELDVSGDILRAIAAGEKPKMIAGRLDLTWRTMIPKAAVIQDQGGR